MISMDAPERELSQLAAGGERETTRIISTLVGLAACCGLGQTALRSSGKIHWGNGTWWSRKPAKFEAAEKRDVIKD